VIIFNLIVAKPSKALCELYCLPLYLSGKKKPLAFYGTGFLMDFFNNEKVQIALTIYHFYFDAG